MSTQIETPNYHLPLALIACTIAVLLASQIGASKQATSQMKWQTETVEKGITNMQAADKQITEAIKNRESVVKQSGEIQNQLQTLLNELLDLAKTDNDAAEIIKKWNVQRSAPPAGADAAAAPAAAAPTDATKAP